MSDVVSSSDICAKFNELKLPIPPNFEKYSIEEKMEIFHYLVELSEIERDVYKIAHDHLNSSFSVTRSNGFTQWKNTKT
jgi:hypothetical protein